MELIKDIGTKKNDKGKTYRYGLFQCSFCNLICERMFFNGKKAKSCGCQKYVKKYEKGRKYQLLECEICGINYEQQDRLFQKAKWKNRCKLHRKKLVLIDGKYISPFKALKNSGGPTEKCAKCGKLIWRGSSHCKSCAQKGISRTGEVIKVKHCITCGKELSRKSKEYCLKCWNKVQDKGLSRERTKFTLSQEWKDVRSECFRRDDFTCQICNIKNMKGLKQSVVLNAHHIVHYRAAPELRLELSNLITLCEKCHYNVHKNDTGENRANTKLTKKNVQTIKKMLNAGVSQKKIAVEFNISQSTVSHIASGRTWKDI